MTLKDTRNAISSPGGAAVLPACGVGAVHRRLHGLGQIAHPRGLEGTDVGVEQVLLRGVRSGYWRDFRHGQKVTGPDRNEVGQLRASGAARQDHRAQERKARNRQPCRETQLFV